MKKIIFAILAVASIFLVSACSGNSAPVVTVTEFGNNSQNNISDRDLKEEAYLLTLRSAGNLILNSASDSELLEIGYTVCDILDQGYTTEDIIEYMAREMVRDGNTSDSYAQAVGYIIGASEATICSVSV